MVSFNACVLFSALTVMVGWEEKKIQPAKSHYTNFRGFRFQKVEKEDVNGLVQLRFHIRFHTALVSHNNSDCQAINPWRPIILCGRSTGIEQSAVSRTSCIVAYQFPTRIENISLLLEFSGPLVANNCFLLCYMPLPYWLCKVPLQRSAWQCHSKHF